MANFLYRLRFTISHTFGLLPSAEAYEKKEISLMNDLNRFKSVQESSLLNRYTELKAFVESPEFKEVKHSLSLLVYKGSSECIAESRLASLRNNSSLKKYFSFKDSAPYLSFLKVEGSKKLHLHYLPNEIPYYPEGKKDDTQLSVIGATEIAKIFIEEVKKQKLLLEKYIKK